MTTQFHFQEAVKALQAGKNLNGKDGVVTGLIKKLSEVALQAEFELHQQPNRKKGSNTKTVKSSMGNFELDTQRDRSGSFEPQFVKKNQTSLIDEIYQK